MKIIGIGVLLLLTVDTAGSVAQTTEGAIRGHLRDEQGAALPGVTVTATSPQAARPFTTVSDQEGYYRLLNLPPGEYTIAAELQGFSKVVRENVVMRAGLNVDVDFMMRIGNLTETIEVKGETPLLETAKAGQAVNVSGELQRSLPLAARRHWSEFLRLAPGAVATDTTVDQASVFYVHGAGIVSGSSLIDGADMTSAVNPWTGYIALPDLTIADVQIKTSGLDASAPLGLGAAGNVVVKSGTNKISGAATFAYTPKSWVSNNTPGATSQSQTITQPELAIGGPIERDHWWFFGSYMRRIGTLGLSRPADQIAAMKALVPSFSPFDNDISANIVFLKVTGQLSPRHQISGFYNYDATPNDKDTGFNTGKFTHVVIGGTGSATRVTSNWNDWLTSRVGVSWNDKSAIRYLVRENASDPSRPVFRTAFTSSGQLVGATQLATLDNTVSETQSPYKKWTINADATAYRSGWIGSHELQAGVFLQPRMTRLDTIRYANGGFALEELVLRDPNNPAAGAIPFHRRIYDAGSGTLAKGHFSDNALYVQDAWRPTPRLTINAGLRVDHVSRNDDLFTLQLQNSWEIGPRVGLNYVLTSDQRNGLRGSFMRVADAVNVNHQSASGAGSQGSGAQTIGYRDLYDLSFDGSFRGVFVTPAASPVSPNRIIDPAYHQPFVDEWAAGYRRQLPGQASVDIGFIRRDYRQRTALVEQNGIYTGGVFQGYTNVAQNDISLLTNNIWNWPVYTSFEVVGTKQTERFQFLGTYTRVWPHLAGTYQPNDPASFIQPGSFANVNGLEGNDNRSASLANSYSATTGGPEWTNHVFHGSVVYRAPWDFLVAVNYTLQKGWWSGPILTRIGAADPQFGPSTIRLSNGRVVSNPLATTLRFAFPTRGEGQYQLPGTHYLNLRIGRDFRLGGNRRFGVDFDALNLPNTAGYQGFLSGANQLFSTNYGKGGNVQPPRTLQLALRYLF
jgi:outer membrane receptor protein involved in Fe transport